MMPRGVTATHSRDIKEIGWVRALPELEEVGQIAGERANPCILCNPLHDAIFKNIRQVYKQRRVMFIQA